MRSASEFASCPSPDGNLSYRQGLGDKIARHRGMKKAIVALARPLAVITHRM
jgi:hypothetical protein